MRVEISKPKWGDTVTVKHGSTLKLPFRSGIGNARKWRKIVGSETFGVLIQKNVVRRVGVTI
jgi:hypothetical protein